MNCPGLDHCEIQEHCGYRNCADASGQCMNKESAMNFDLIVVYPGDCLALLNLDIEGDGRDWECTSATLKKLAPHRHPSKRVRGTWLVDWTSLPTLDIALDTGETADQFEIDICDGLDAAKAEPDDGDYRYEQMKDRRMGL